ncbi:MAG: hypothetical protein GY851_08100 [bacterium]|nr:hypothetical protein [bacterium]
MQHRRRIILSILTAAALCFAGAFADTSAQEPAGEATNLYHFSPLGVGSCGGWRPVGDSRIEAGRWSNWEPGNTVNLHLFASKAGLCVHGMRLDGLALPVPDEIRFRVYADVNYLILVVADSAGTMHMSQAPLPGIPNRQWVDVSVSLAELLPVGVDAPDLRDLDSVAIVTRPAAGEFRVASECLFAFKDFAAVYPVGHGPTDPPQPTPEDLARVIEPLAELVPTIDALFEEAQEEGVDTRYARVTRTVIERYRGELSAMLTEGCCFFTVENAHYLVRAANRLRTDLERLIADPASAVQYPDVDLQNLRCIDGTFHSGDRPVILTGLCGWFKTDHFDELADMGYTCVSTEIGPRHTLLEDGSTNQESLDSLRTVLDAAAQHNMAVDLLLSPHYFPGWASERWPGTDAAGLRKRLNPFMPWSVTSPEFRQIVADHLAVTIPFVKDHPALNSYNFINEAWYRMLPDYPTALWDAHRAANAETDELQSLADITTDNVTDFLKWNMAELAKHDTQHPVHIKSIGTEDCLSVDREAIGDILTANGMDAMPSWPDLSRRLGVDFAWPYLRHDFHRSLQPDNPIMDGEYHMSAGAEDFANMPDNYTYAALWGLAMHGRDMGTNWVFGRPDTASVYWHVNAVDALGRTSLDLLRLAPEVHAFQRQRGPVGLYYGPGQTTDAYYACLFHDRDVGVITDRRVRDGELERYRVIVVPWPGRYPDDVRQSFSNFETNGGVVVELPHTRDLEVLWACVGKAVETACPAPAVDLDVWGVECRSIVLDGRGLFYVLNHRRDAVRVAPESTWDLEGARDLVTGRAVDVSAIELEPLEFRLFEAVGG